MSKARAARAVARVEQAEQRERDKLERAITAKKERARAVLLRKKERERQRKLEIEGAKARKKAEESARRKLERDRRRALMASNRAERRQAREEAIASKQRAREDAIAAKLRAREDAIAAKEDARTRREAERARDAARLQREREMKRIALTIRRADQATARAEARAAREREKRAAIEHKERARVEAKAQKQREREEANARKQRERQARELHKLQLGELQRRLAECEKSQRKRFGSSLVELYRCFIEVWGARPDLIVECGKDGPPFHDAEPLEQADLPDAVLLWHQAWGRRALSWRFSDDEHGIKRGILRLDDTLNDDGARARLSELFEQRLIESLRRVWISSPEQLADTLARVAKQSAPTLLPRAQILSAFAEDGKPSRAWRALVELFDADAHLLVHALRTNEGRRRQDLLAKGTQVPDDDFEPSLLSEMQQGPVVQKEEFVRLLARHERFLEKGGGGGSWLRRFTGGLPAFAYRHPRQTRLPRGQARAPMENLSDVQFQGVRLAYADLSGILAPGANFSKTDLAGAVLAYSSLARSTFRGADLTLCDFSRSRLEGADFRGANLTDTNFEGANLTGAHFGGATTVRTRFGGAIVAGIKY